MKRAKILVIDLNPSDRLGDDLRTIIESEFDVEEVRISDEIGTDLAATKCRKTLARVIARSNPSVIFLVQSSDRLRHTKRLFHSPEIDVPKIPLLVVVDEADPDEMIDWIRQLAADFLTKPLKKIDVLPRIWRLLDQTTRRRKRSVSDGNRETAAGCEMRCQHPDHRRHRNRQGAVCASYSLPKSTRQPVVSSGQLWSNPRGVDRERVVWACVRGLYRRQDDAAWFD
jgi:DNA-binding NtrC family response regulator